MEFSEFGLWIIDEDELTEEERANLPWNNEEDEDNGWHPSPNIKDDDPWSMYTYNEESDYY